MPEVDSRKEAKAFWGERRQNVKVSVWAHDNGHFEAADSRFYYALRLGAQAMFRIAGKPWPTPHNMFIEDFARELASKGHGVLNADLWMSKAATLRNRADYESYNVGRVRSEELERNCIPIPEVLEHEFKEIEY